jgi:hypothetical protein
MLKYSMEDIKNTFNEYIHLKNTSNYLDEFGGSIFATVFILLIFAYTCSYIYIKTNLKNLKDEFEIKRCHPAYIPFVSMIQKDPNMSSVEMTRANFTYCANRILHTISDGYMAPMTYTITIMSGLMTSAIGDINAIRNKFADIINNIANIDKEIMYRVMSTVIPLQQVFIKMKDNLEKSVGVFVTGIFATTGGLYIVEGFVKTFITLIVSAMVALLAMILPLLLFFFTAPLAAIPLAAFVALSAFVTVVIIKMSPLYNLPTTSVPNKPSVHSCFDQQTLIKVANGSWKYIYELELNEELYGENHVVAIFKMSSVDVQMYNYKQIIVSGSHRVFLTWNQYNAYFNTEKRGHSHDEEYHLVDKALYAEFLYERHGTSRRGVWMYVRELPDAIPIESYKQPFIWCLNTTKKYIELAGIANDIITKKVDIEPVYAMDWDEIVCREDADTLKRNFERSTDILFPSFVSLEPSLIHKYFESGFAAGTGIYMADGSIRTIENIHVHDMLLSPNVEHNSHIADAKYMTYNRATGEYVPIERLGHINRVLGIVKVSKKNLAMKLMRYTHEMLYNTCETFYMLDDRKNDIIAAQNITVIGNKQGFSNYNLIQWSPHHNGFCPCPCPYEVVNASVKHQHSSFIKCHNRMGCVNEMGNTVAIIKKPVREDVGGMWNYLKSWVYTQEQVEEAVDEEVDEGHIYHLITSEGMFYTEGFIVGDYNYGLDVWNT